MRIYANRDANGWEPIERRTGDAIPVFKCAEYGFDTAGTFHYGRTAHREIPDGRTLRKPDGTPQATADPDHAANLFRWQHGRSSTEVGSSFRSKAREVWVVMGESSSRCSAAQRFARYGARAARAGAAHRRSAAHRDRQFLSLRLGWCAPTQASMPIRRGGKLSSRVSTCPRDYFCRSAIAPRYSGHDVERVLPDTMPITAVPGLISLTWRAPCL